MNTQAIKLFATVLAVFAGANLAHGEEIVGHAIPDSSFPISRTVEIPGDATVVYLSGMVPSVINPAAEQNGAREIWRYPDADHLGS